jgi:hypothetical protein
LLRMREADELVRALVSPHNAEFVC